MRESTKFIVHPRPSPVSELFNCWSDSAPVAAMIMITIIIITRFQGLFEGDTKQLSILISSLFFFPIWATAGWTLSTTKGWSSGDGGGGLFLQLTEEWSMANTNGQASGGRTCTQTNAPGEGEKKNFLLSSPPSRDFLYTWFLIMQLRMDCMKRMWEWSRLCTPVNGGGSSSTRWVRLCKLYVFVVLLLVRIFLHHDVLIVAVI